MIQRFGEIGPDDLGKVGGKGLNLGLLTGAGFPVPPGFCVTTDGFVAFTAGCDQMPALYDALDKLSGEDVAAVREVGERVRAALLTIALPDAVTTPLRSAYQQLGEGHSYAVRSSATAEDLPGASFAGQQDTYLNVRGQDALCDAVKRCFVSLFTDRAILYRARNRFGHRGVLLSVVVQRMVFPDAAGILFTADPVSGHRGVLSIDAGFGLGEALVSGLVSADLYRVDRKSGALREVRVGDKAVAIRALPEGGTERIEVSPAQRQQRVLSDDQVRALADLGQRVEAYYGGVPQDLEWGIEGGQIYLLQARPITSLYPLPAPAPTDGATHVYFSFSHGQNMIDPLTPLGIELLQIILPFGKHRPGDASIEQSALLAAGSRLYIDVTSVLRVPPLRRALRGVLQTIYPEIAQGVESLADRPDVRRAAGVSIRALPMLFSIARKVVPGLLHRWFVAPPVGWAAWADAFVEKHITALQQRVAAAPAGAARLRVLRVELAAIFAVVPQVGPPLGAGILAMKRLRARFQDTPHSADLDAIQRGFAGNVTTEMDLMVGDLADSARPYPDLIAALRRGIVDRPGLHALRGVAGGPQFVDAVERFLDRFGMRCQGEIDIGRPRWAERPGLLMSSVLGGLSREGAGSHRAHFQRLRDEGEAAGRRLVAAAGAGRQARRIERWVQVARAGLAVREHPKFFVVRCFGFAHEEIGSAAAELVQRGRLDVADDVWFLHYDELLAQMEGTTPIDVRAIVARRRKELEHHRHLVPPIVMTSEGEVPLPSCAADRPQDLPPGALAGLGASAGVVEGIAHVILSPETEVLQAGEILIAPYTDPGWTPLFVHAAGLVCDIGGLMTHGSVIAREYGIPAVVGVGIGVGTKKIRTGQKIRVDGSRGIVEILE